MGMITVWDTISLMGYIHPTFVKTISAPQRNKKKHFAQMQESGRKDVERAFGVLQSRYVIVRGPARYWDIETLKDIMLTCIVLHNMIVEDERGQNLDNDYDTCDGIPSISISRERISTFMEFLQLHLELEIKVLIFNSKMTLWEKHGIQM